MSKKALLNLTLFTLLLIAAAAVYGAVRYYTDLPQNLSQHETVLVGQNRLVPGSSAAMRVLVRDSKDGSPLSDAAVEVSLASAEAGQNWVLFSGKTGPSGAADVRFNVPAEAGQEGRLVVKTRSKLGSDTIERPVRMERDYRVLLTTDKPLYQPGQVIHIRALALSAFDLTPAAEQALEITVADGKGNKVFRQPLNTSRFGAASADFQLADEVNTGNYKITAVLGATSSEKTVVVEHYVLPKFDVKLETSQPYYQPGQHVEGSLDARYFFGKPVSDGAVKIEGFTYDVEKSSIFTLDGRTDAEGRYAFSFDLPAYLAGSSLEGGIARFYLQASVIDQAQHTEIADLSLPVSSSGLIIEAAPESSSFRPGVENILYVLTSTPDGRPASADLTVRFNNSGQVIDATSGEYGLAEVRFTPDSPYQYITIDARSPQGSAAQREFQFDGEYQEESVLLRPERPFYRVGETMNLDIFTATESGAIYLDIVRDGQTISTQSLTVQQGRAEAAVDLTPDLFGTLELHAYRVMPSGSIVRDTRLVVVSQADELSMNITTGEERYRPGDTAHLNLQVTGSDGKGVESAVGLAIVDEAVFALAESDPGFARLYFLLEKEIMQPRYDLHGYSLPEMMREGQPSDPALEQAANGAAQASLSEVLRGSSGGGAMNEGGAIGNDGAIREGGPVVGGGSGGGGGRGFSLVANSHQDALERANTQQRLFFAALYKGAMAAAIAFPLLAAGLALWALKRERVLGRALLLALLGATSITLFLLLVRAPGAGYWGSGPLDQLSSWLYWLESSGEGLLYLLAILVPLAWLGLTVIAIRRRDLLLGWLLAAALLHLLVFFLVVAASSYAGSGVPGDAIAVLLLIGLLVTPLALLARSAGYFAKRRIFSGVLMLAAFTPMVVLLPAIANSGSMAGSTAMNRQLRGGIAVEDGVMAPAAAAPMAGMVKAEESKEVEKPSAAGLSQQGEPPRLRQYFPETMLWLPDAVTAPDGSLALDIPVADSITTWRMTALASSQDGRLGSTSAPLLVFQDFFIDLDLPSSLTVGDEVSVPVGVYNYLPEAQQVRLELEAADWFELRGDAVQEITIEANDVGVVYFPIRATRFGSQPFQVTATGSKMSDAIRKEVRVFPNGKEIRFTQSDQLKPGEPVTRQVNIPAGAIPGTQKVLVKIYPGVLSQVVEGLDSMLRMPFGCFEQTSSTTYPNLLVMDYLQTTKQTAPETQMKAEEYINLGYQRLATFEVEGGGFSLFGDAPADRMLTAYGLQEFSDMSRVHSVDPEMIRRAADWLFTQQASDGSWENDRGLVHENTWSSLGNDRLPVTAYIAWSLVEAGFSDDPRTNEAIAYLRENAGQAEDPYVLGLVANALVSADLKVGGHEILPATAALLDRLAGKAKHEGGGAYWQSGVATFMGSEGQTGSVETTALAALALLRSEHQPEIANAALAYLVRQKDSYGTWYSTQATVLTLKALLQSVRGSGENADAQITLTLNGGQARTLQVNAENFDVVQMVSFDDINIGAENNLEIRVEGRGSLMYQVAGSYYLPWAAAAQYPEQFEQGAAVQIEASYDRTELAVNDTITETVSVQLKEPGAKAQQAIIDLGIAPGFAVQAETLDALVNQSQDTAPDDPSPRIQRYELTGRQVIVYVTNLSEGNPLSFSFQLKARFPVSAQVPASIAYDYYNPNLAGEVPPQELVVTP